MSLPTTYYKIEALDDSNVLTILSSDQIPLDENITQFIIQRNELENIPSTSNEFTYFIDDIKTEPEVMMPDLIMPDVEEVQEIVEEQAVDVYEITRNPQGELECPVCRANFKIIANLERHIQIHAKKFVFEIPKGNNTIPKAIDGPPKLALYPCEFCSEAFEYKRHLTRHLMSEHKDRKKDSFKCEKCNYKTDNNFSLREHQQRHQSLEDRIKQNPDMLKCKECPAVLKTMKNLKVHEKQVHQREKNRCEQCNKGFKTRKLFNSHMEKIHSQDELISKVFA
jgi:uncharacterized C2H2 Zn-finger protein